MLKFLKGLFAPPAAPALGMTTHPVALNPSKSSQVARNVGRLARLMRANDPKFADEIRRRKGALMLAGYDAPETAEDAEALLGEVQ